MKFVFEVPLNSAKNPVNISSGDDVAELLQKASTELQKHSARMDDKALSMKDTGWVVDQTGEVVATWKVVRD